MEMHRIIPGRRQLPHHITAAKPLVVLMRSLWLLPVLLHSVLGTLQVTCQVEETASCTVVGLSSSVEREPFVLTNCYSEPQTCKQASLELKTRQVVEDTDRYVR